MIELRRWQSQAVPIACDAIRAGKRGLVSAVMGAGKSIFLAELIRRMLPGLGDGYHVVVSTPTVALVDQLHATLSAYLETSVGRYYTHAKEVQRVTVLCNDSAPDFVALGELGAVALWVADEAHRTESAGIYDAIGAAAPYGILGLSATPYLAEEARRLRLFDDLLYEYSAQDAMADGVVCMPEIVHYTGSSLDANEALLEMIPREHGPGIVNACSISDAIGFADMLSAAGVACAVVHSRMRRADVRAALDGLQAGDLRCVVHVRMLSEGVDLPWLRWMALRRPTRSRVAFCQEVGRVLRAYPGKDKARILDPLDLFHDFGLSYEAMLGMGGEPPLPAVEEAAQRLCRELDMSGEVVPLPIWFDALSSYLRRTCMQLYALGLAERRIKSRGWRNGPPTLKQLQAVGRLAHASGSMPDPHRRLIDEAVQSCAAGVDDWPFGACLSCGDVADLLEILIATRGHGWPDLT